MQDYPNFKLLICNSKPPVLPVYGHFIEHDSIKEDPEFLFNELDDDIYHEEGYFIEEPGIWRRLRVPSWNNCFIEQK